MATNMISGAYILSALAIPALWFFERIRIFSSLPLIDLLSCWSTELSSASLLHGQSQLSIAPSSYQRQLVQPVPLVLSSILLPPLTNYPRLLFRAVMVIYISSPTFQLWSHQISFTSTLFSVASASFLFDILCCISWVPKSINISDSHCCQSSLECFQLFLKSHHSKQRCHPVPWLLASSGTNDSGRGLVCS